MSSVCCPRPAHRVYIHYRHYTLSCAFYTHCMRSRYSATASSASPAPHRRQEYLCASKLKHEENQRAEQCCWTEQALVVRLAVELRLGEPLTTDPYDQRVDGIANLEGTHGAERKRFCVDAIMCHDAGTSRTQHDMGRYCFPNFTSSQSPTTTPNRSWAGQGSANPTCL